MKIAMIGQKGIPAAYGGIEKHVEELSVELAQNFLNPEKNEGVFVYARKWYTPEDIAEYKGVKIIHTPTLHTKHLDAIAHTLASTIHAIKNKMDIIHYHGVGPALLCWIPRIFSPKIKVVVTLHCLDRFHQKWGYFARLMLRLGEWAGCAYAHQAISVSKVIQNYCLNEYRKPTACVPNGVRSPEPADGATLENWNLKSGKYILMVSRLVRHKGAHYLVDAWKKARAKNPELLSDYKLVIVGGSSFTDDYIYELVEASKDEESIVFTDWQKGSALNDLYANAALLVHPSENEGLPITVLQAMSYGRAALVSDIPEHQEVIADGKFWFANADSVSLTEKIIELLSEPETLKKTGLQNKKLTESRYNWNGIASKVWAIYGYSEKEPLIKYGTLEI